ncbi:MarR family winged helix-turn-helix transcriptional regulator [Streptomyces yaanensis]|uniref:MarR family winged helix-turn-helix transcriptional regulator n=1 Tax=Streptomyces yaanensis TaxID=1142239 RepID=A0ABV7SGB7_9ACTN|nr:MarR family winged helix-turn-helix transcriptional regulator [Streptomyces sp. CGMCC 4.7035]WNC01007.1 MarR family winged helix-turn-helix transcriptional regulator [Streptomyces sp. CGMCC 4.7035]
METSTQSPPVTSDLLDAVGPAFSRLRRTQALNVEKQVSRKDMTRTLVLNIVQDGPEHEGQEITVGVVGERLAVDPSVASRMVSDCITAGYLVRAASQRDGRRTILQLTPEGHETLARFRGHQRAAFERITQDWPEEDRLEFARLLIKYVDSIAELQADAAE